MSTMQSEGRRQGGAKLSQPPEEVIDRLSELLPEGALDEPSFAVAFAWCAQTARALEEKEFVMT